MQSLVEWCITWQNDALPGRMMHYLVEWCTTWQNDALPGTMMHYLAEWCITCSMMRTSCVNLTSSWLACRSPFSSSSSLKTSMVLCCSPMPSNKPLIENIQYTYIAFSGQLLIPHFRKKRIGNRSFSFSAPNGKEWSSLSNDLHDSSISLFKFKSILKMHFFTEQSQYLPYT